MLQKIRYELPDIPYDATARQKVDLNRDMQTHALSIDIRSQVTIAAGTTDGAVVAENPLTLVNFLRILENGETTVEWDPRALAQVTEREGGRPSPVTALLSGAVQGPLQLRAQIWLNFASPLSAKPQETAYVPLDPKLPLQLEVEWAPDRKAALVSAANDRTFTFANTIVRVVQHQDPFAVKKPFFLYRTRRIDSQAIVGAMTDFPLEIRSKNRIRAILLHSLSAGVSNPGVISLVTFKGDKRDYFRRVQYEELRLEERHHYGGSVDDDSYLMLNMQDNGLLSQIWNPLQDVNPRFEMNVAQIGATSTIVRAYAIELIEVAGFTADNGGKF